MGRPIDTSSDAYQRQIEMLRAMTPARRLRIADEMSSEVRELAASGLRRTRPALSEGERHDALAEMLLGPQPVNAARRERMDHSR